MSMAVECARWDWLSPSVVASKTKSCSSNRFNVASSTAGLVFEVQQNYGGQKGYMSLACQASSGGSRRDYEKILARKKNRRVRHMKGVTPSTPDLIKTLESEKRDQAKLELDGVNDDEAYDYEDKVEDEEEFEDSDTPDVCPA